jgi:CRISPR system Cascade subunit CasA
LFCTCALGLNPALSTQDGLMVFNLLVDPFFPIVTKSGAKRWISFVELAQTDGHAPVEFDWPRPDFNMASYEFCVGVLAVAFQPNQDLWQKLWNEPPSRSDLEAALRPLLSAFNLNGDGPRFMQDLEAFASNEPNPIEALLIDTPGFNGQKKNADLLTHRERYAELGLPAAAMALYALQQFAPSGGAGNRTSLRGGGPLTCLVMPSGEPESLWRKILANLPLVDGFTALDETALKRIFPWLAPTLLSGKAHGERELAMADPAVHPLQAHFGMPRRIRLHLSEVLGPCGLTGQSGPMVTGYDQKPWGANYGLWVHPLTPYRRQKEADEPYSVKPKSGRFGYRDWVSISYGSEEGKLAMPAEYVKAITARGSYFGKGAGARLRVGGWAMSNMEAGTFLLAETPLYLTADAARWNDMATVARKLAKAGDEGHNILRQALRHALFSDGAKPSTDAGLFETARTQFYEQTENAFHEILQAVSLEEEPDISNHAPVWLKQLSNVTSRIFDEQVPAPAGDQKQGQRSAVAHGRMISAFKGDGASGKNLFTTLEVPVPEQASKKSKTKEKKQ